MIDTRKYFARTEKHDRRVTAQKAAMGTNGLGTITSRSLSHHRRRPGGRPRRGREITLPFNPAGGTWGMCAMLNREPSIASFPNTPYRCGTNPRVHMVKTAHQSHCLGEYAARRVNAAQYTQSRRLSWCAGGKSRSIAGK